MDFSAINGQEHSKRGLEVAVAGKHNILLIGGSATPKTALARCLTTITDRPVEVIAFNKKPISINEDALVVVTLEPCPCGNFLSLKRECLCTPLQIQKHLSALPEFLLTKLDIQLEISEMSNKKIRANVETSKQIRKRVEEASKNKIPADLDEGAKELLKMAILELSISAKAYDKIVNIGKTITRLAGKDVVGAEHISEAIGYRSLDRNLWS